MDTIAVKFGGSSLASAAQIKKAADIIRADANRRYVVVSAPGKRDDADVKVTDLLYRCYDEAAAGQDFSETLGRIADRYAQIIRELPVDFDLDAEIDVLREHLRTKPNRDYMASRGEYLNGRVIAAYLGYPFVEPAECIFFTDYGVLDEERTFRVLGDRLRSLPNAVVPGFYGAMPDGRVRTFSRGGSDITGSVVALAVKAKLYENWTDVSGMLSADPRVVDNPGVIEHITYTELRELSYMGASVLHEDAIFPVRRGGIPINIRNTNRPGDPGTMIEPVLTKGIRRGVVTGVAGKKGFTCVCVEKSMMNAEVGFIVKLLGIFAKFGVPFEHCPTGIDTVSVIVDKNLFEQNRENVLLEIQRELSPDAMTVEDDAMALIAVVGHGMTGVKGTAARVLKGLADGDINIRLIDQGSSELNIIVGVNEADCENAIRAIYSAVESLM